MQEREDRWKMRVSVSKSNSKRLTLIKLGLLLLTVSWDEVLVKANSAVPKWVVYPDKQWTEVTPVQAGFNAKKFKKLIATSSPKGANFGGEVHDGNNWGAVLTRGGYLVYTWGNPDYKYQSASLGKAFTWALVGLAVDEGLINPDEPIWKSWSGEGQLSHPHKYLYHGYHKTLTWRHLLNNQGGFPITGGHNWSRKRNPRYPFYNIPKWAKWTGDPIFDNYAHCKPGVRKHYSSGGYWRLSQALTAIWKKDLKQVLDERIFRHIGISVDNWDWTPGKVIYDTIDWYPSMLGYGKFIDLPYEIDGHIVRGGPGWIVMSPRDLARFGLLVATGGIWKDRRLISPEWIRGHAGGNGSLVEGDRATYISLGIVCSKGFPSKEAFKNAIVGPVVAKKPQKVQSEVSYPPRLHDGISVATMTSDELIEPPSSLKGMAVAKTAPVVDFLYYPGQTYKGNPWSNWGDGVAADGKYYSSIGDHKAPEGNAFVYEYDSKAKSLRYIVDIRKLLNLPEGHYTPGKIHGRLDMGADGWLYFSTHRGSTRVTTDQYHYQGDWILRHHPKSGKTQIVAHGPVGQQCIPCSVLDPERLIFYGGTVAGDINDKRNMFFAYDMRSRKLVYSCYKGPARYMIFAKSTGRVYFTPGLASQLYRYEPRKGGSKVGLAAEIGLRAATQETPQGFIYTVSKEGALLYRFDTKTEDVKQIGSAAIGRQTYITSIDSDPTGRYLYYVPGAHGGSEKDGAAVVQFDTQTKKKKVIAFLHPFLKKRYGYTPLGTFSTAVDPAGDKLYITWNGNLGGSRRVRLTWDACALTVIHIPESERLP
jgi:CubicO group peptidase (beta-lactamase class C family)